MFVTEYAAKFVELAKFYPHYSAETTEFSKCIKFENGLSSDIKTAIGYCNTPIFYLRYHLISFTCASLHH